MTKNAEKLARELIALSERYSERDFNRAEELLLSGKLFSKAIAVSRQAKATGKRFSEKDAPEQGIDQKLPLLANDLPREEIFSDEDLERFIKGATQEERKELLSFGMRFQRRKILSTSYAARNFSRKIGLNLPRVIPARSILVGMVLERLMEISEHERKNIIFEVNRSAPEESSLKRWSDLIVKRGES